MHRRRPPRGPEPAAAARGYNLFDSRPRARRGAAARGRRLGARPARRELGAVAGGAADRVGRAGQRVPAGAAHARPLRPPHRRGRVPPRLARADAARRRRTGCTRCRGASRGRARTSRAPRCSSSWSQVEAGHVCPISMTYSARAGAARAARARRGMGAAAHLARRTTRASCRPREKRGALCGMAMTEKQGGSDVRANTTRAERSARRARRRVRAHRPQVVLLGADVRRVPRARADRARALAASWCRAGCPTARATRFRIQRLKDKLGNRSNASSEIEFDGAWARMVGEEGRGVPTIIEMVNHTRLDCVLGSAAGMRQARRAGDRTTPRTAAPSASGSSTSR